MRKERYTLEKINKIAKEKGGECLSTQYINFNSKLKWKCNKNHTWETSLDVIKKNCWCPYCKKVAKLTLKTMNKVALEKKGICLSNKYINNKTKLKWKCDKNHIWEAIPSNILKGGWCPYCSGYVKHNLNYIKDYARKNNIICLSNKYFNREQIITWKCKKNHIWNTTFDVIRKNCGCPICLERKKEKLCRKIFEEIYKMDFKKVKPNWLKYNKRPLELDGYNENLKIAFEYNGEQHYIPIHFFHNKHNLKEVQKRDKFKEQKCKEKGILLIIIPYTIKRNNLKDYILEKLSCPQIKLNFIGGI